MGQSAACMQLELVDCLFECRSEPARSPNVARSHMGERLFAVGGACLMTGH